MSVELRQPSQIEDCRHFFSGKWQVKGKSGKGGKRGVPDSEFREQFYIHQGIRDKLKQSSFNAYGLLYQSFVVKKGESLSLIMRNDNLMKISFVCVMFVFDPFLVVFIKGTFSSCLI